MSKPRPITILRRLVKQNKMTIADVRVEVVCEYSEILFYEQALKQRFGQNCKVWTTFKEK